MAVQSLCIPSVTNLICGHCDYYAELRLHATCTAILWGASLVVNQSACGEPPAKHMTGLFYPPPPLWDSLGFSGPLWASASPPASQPPSQSASQPAKCRTGSLIVHKSSSQPASQPGPWSQFCFWVHRRPGRNSVCGEPPWS